MGDRLTNAIVAKRHTDRIAELTLALKALVADCPTSLSCEDFDHRLRDDPHGAEEDCPPCCRYYKALHEASEMLK